MRKTILYFIAAVFALALLARATTYTVRFTEAAVVTTFGSADASAARMEPGLKFKWPDPIQSVTKYDTRQRFLQTRSETQQTADARQLVVEAFCTWRVKDPLEFFKRFSSAGPSASDHYRRAEELLRGSLRSAMGEISKFRMGDLFAKGSDGSKLGELESRVLAGLRRADVEGGSLESWGIEVTGVGVSRISLPEETAREVVNSMKSDRTRLIRDLESKGEADEKRITSVAQANANRIEAFAREYAEEIRRRGNLEAEQFVRMMAEVPELALLLKNAEFIRNIASKQSTFVFNTGMPGFRLMSPTASEDAQRGIVPGAAELLREDPMRRLAPAGGPSSGMPGGGPVGGPVGGPGGAPAGSPAASREGGR